MKALEVTPDSVQASSDETSKSVEERHEVGVALEKVLRSPFFRNSARGKQFLNYVVSEQLAGRSDLLKERTIGAEVFSRPPGYATGDDPVVRVQAGDVRRRLEQYYQASPDESRVRIELPVGSYSPIFHWGSLAGTTNLSAPTTSLGEKKSDSANFRTNFWVIISSCLLLTSIIVFISLFAHRGAVRKSALEQFWSPVFTTQQPLLICVAEPIAYRPSMEMYEKYSRAHPGTFKTEAERYNSPLPLDPEEKIYWRDMPIFSDYGVAIGDTYAAVTLSSLLGRLGKVSQVRIGTNYSFEDLRNSPAVLVGAFNNKWTMQVTSNLHFAFAENDHGNMIQERDTGGRVWNTQMGSHGEMKDFGIVDRLLDSKTGQFTIIVGGISSKGTQAASEFVTNPKYLEEALRNAPKGWQTKNLEFVIETTVTDSIAGPPHVVATYYQ